MSFIGLWYRNQFLLWRSINTNKALDKPEIAILPPEKSRDKEPRWTGGKAELALRPAASGTQTEWVFYVKKKKKRLKLNPEKTYLWCFTDAWSGLRDTWMGNYIKAFQTTHCSDKRKKKRKKGKKEELQPSGSKSNHGRPCTQTHTHNTPQKHWDTLDQTCTLKVTTEHMQSGASSLGTCS